LGTDHQYIFTFRKGESFCLNISIFYDTPESVWDSFELW